MDYIFKCKNTKLGDRIQDKAKLLFVLPLFLFAIALLLGFIASYKNITLLFAVILLVRGIDFISLNMLSEDESDGPILHWLGIFLGIAFSFLGAFLLFYPNLSITIVNEILAFYFFSEVILNSLKNLRKGKDLPYIRIFLLLILNMLLLISSLALLVPVDFIELNLLRLLGINTLVLAFIEFLEALN